MNYNNLQLINVLVFFCYLVLAPILGMQEKATLLFIFCALISIALNIYYVLSAKYTKKKWQVYSVVVYILLYVACIIYIVFHAL